jgi:hypothetical protein
MLVVLVALAVTAGQPPQKPRPPHAAKARHAHVRSGAHKAKLAAVTNTPQEAVQRFLEPRTPADGCAQLSRPYQKHLSRQYGPCLVAIKGNPKVTHLVISHVVVKGKQATLKATYRVPTGPATEYFSLSQIKHTWLISGAQ